MKRLVSIFVITVVAFSAVVIPATSPQAAASSAALSIVPKKNYTVEAGKSIEDTLVVRNLDKKNDLELQLRVVDFTFTDDGGTPKLMLAEDAPQTTWSMKPFLKVPKSVKIPAGESKMLDAKVSIPANQGAGSFYSAIVYSTGSSEGGNVGLSASGVTLVFTSIPGDVNEDLKLEKFGAYREAAGGKKAEYMFVTMKQPELMAYTLKNDGNVTEAPVGSITLKDIFGRETVINDVNPNSSLALIGQSRTYTACVELKAEEVELGDQTTESKRCETPSLWPGYYSASLDLFYGQNGNRTQEISGNASFWYLPWWFILIMTVVFAALFFYGRKLYLMIQSKLSGPKQRKRPRRQR